MAIKGKSRPRGGRVGTNAPRPVIVIKKKPFMQRRTTRWGALLLVLGVIGATLWIGYSRQKASDDRAAQGESVSRINSLIQNHLQGVGQPLPPTNIAILPDMAANLEQFRAGDLSESEMRRSTRGLPDAVQAVIEGINAIELPDDLRNRDYTAELVDSLFLMGQGLQAYQNAAGTLHVSTNVSGNARTALLDQATDTMENGRTLFDRGYDKLKTIRIDLGVFDPTQFGLPQ